MTSTLLGGLRIDPSRLDAVSTATSERRTRVATGTRGVTSSVVSAEVIAETRREGCKCEDRDHMVTRGKEPLVAGMPVSELTFLEEGCAGSQKRHSDGSPMTKEELWNMRPGWVCPRLIEIRKRYGK